MTLLIRRLSSNLVGRSRRLREQRRSSLRKDADKRVKMSIGSWASGVCSKSADHVRSHDNATHQEAESGIPSEGHRGEEKRPWGSHLPRHCFCRSSAAGPKRRSAAGLMRPPCFLRGPRRSRQLNHVSQHRLLRRQSELCDATIIRHVQIGSRTISSAEIVFARTIDVGGYLFEPRGRAG